MSDSKSHTLVNAALASAIGFFAGSFWTAALVHHYQNEAASTQTNDNYPDEHTQDSDSPIPAVSMTSVTVNAPSKEWRVDRERGIRASIRPAVAHFWQYPCIYSNEEINTGYYDPKGLHENNVFIEEPTHPQGVYAFMGLRKHGMVKVATVNPRWEAGYVPHGRFEPKFITMYFHRSDMSFESHPGNESTPVIVRSDYKNGDHVMYDRDMLQKYCRP